MLSYSLALNISWMEGGSLIKVVKSFYCVITLHGCIKFSPICLLWIWLVYRGPNLVLPSPVNIAKSTFFSFLLFNDGRRTFVSFNFFILFDIQEPVFSLLLLSSSPLGWQRWLLSPFVCFSPPGEDWWIPLGIQHDFKSLKTGHAGQMCIFSSYFHS